MPGAMILPYTAFNTGHPHANMGRPETTRNYAFRPPARARAPSFKPRAPGGRHRERGHPMGRDSDDAAASLHLLDTHYREHPNRGPAERRSTSPTPGTPLNLGVVDYIDRCVGEVIDHARTQAGHPLPPLPARARDVYDWWHEQTEDADRETQLRRDIVIYRQKLEHRIALGEHKAVRPHPCPACATYGLEWSPERGMALCFNRKCRDRHGMGRTWTLARLATQYVTAKETRARRAT